MKALYFLTAVIAATFLNFIDAAKILAVFPFPGKSHHNYVRAVTDHLATKGHDLTIYTALPSGKNLKNIKEIELRTPCADEFVAAFDFKTIQDFSEVPIFGPPKFLLMGSYLANCTMDNPKLAELINSNEKYDLIILEPFFIQEALVAFGHKFQAPVVALVASTTLVSSDEYVGNPFGVSYIPIFELRYNDRMSFFQRVHNALRTFIFVASNYLFYVPSQESIMRRYFSYPGSENIPPLTEMLQNVSLIVANTQMSVDYAKPWVPNVIAAGGVHISQTRKPLPKDLQEFMDNSKHGVIYVSFGSVVPSEQMPDELKQSFLTAFGKLKQNVIWKFSPDSLTYVPKNVKVGKWLPQQDILAHPKCLAFMTHGGFLSHQEAVYFGVPLIGVPFFGDQFLNARRAADRGFAISLDQFNITDESLMWAFNEVLSKPSYRETVKHYSKLFRDTPMPPLENAAYWIDYVIRHKGAPELRSEGRNLPYYKHLLLDVVAFMLLVLGLLVFIVCKTTKFLCTGCYKKNITKKVTPSKKNK